MRSKCITIGFLLATAIASPAVVNIPASVNSVSQNTSFSNSLPGDAHD